MAAAYIEIAILTSINAIGIFVILVVLTSRPVKKVHYWLAILAICMMGWANFAYVGYIEPSEKLALDLYKLNGTFVIGFLLAMHIFVGHYLKRKQSISNLLVIYIAAILIFLELFTPLITSDVIRQDWGNEVSFGPLNYLIYIFALVISIRVTILLFIHYFVLPQARKRKHLYFLLGTFAFILFNIIFNILVPELLGTVRYQHFGDYASIFFLGFTAYAILKHKFINPRLVALAFLLAVTIMFISGYGLSMVNNSLDPALQSNILSAIEIMALTTINSGAIFIIIILLANSANNKLYQWFVVMVLSIIAWVNFSYLGYNTADIELALLFFRLNMAAVALCFVAEYMVYIDNFLGIKKPTVRLLVIIISLLFILLSFFTDSIIDTVYKQDWGNEIGYGPANIFFSLFAFILNLGLFVNFLRRYFKLQSAEKSKVLYFLLGTILFIMLNIIFNMVVPAILNTARYQRLGDYSSIVFLIFTAYAILRRKFMNLKIALTAFLIGIIGMLIIADIFALSHNLLEQGIKFLILLLFALISVFLVRSVLREIKQKEELAAANQALAVSKQKLFDLASEQKDIIDVMGHEIRTPLTAIVQEIKLHKKHTLPLEDKLLVEAASKPELQKILPYLLESVKTIDQASLQAVALVNDMLETARLDKNRFELNYEKFDLVELIKTTVELMQKTVDLDDTVKHEIVFNEPEFKQLPIEADKTRIGQALQALLNNAIKYRDPHKPDISIKVSITSAHNQVLISIADNGIGIDQADIAKLGKKFVRLNPKTKGNLKRPGGTGLGLYVVKGIMAHHHGELIIASAGIGKGSTFSLKFPTVRAK